ncbi:WhiB family transcriptional regulator [Pseudonocardia sediminis]
MVGRGNGWRARAACLSVDPELFFPAAENGVAHARQVARAKRVCGRCPVRDECLAWAIESLPHGIAGGTTAGERRVARTTRPARCVSACRDSAGFHVPVGAQQIPSRRRSPIVAAGKAALAGGAPRAQVAVEFGVSRRTVDRWAAAVRSASLPGGGA